MQIVSSSDARNHLAAMLDQAQHAPITIQKQGRNTAVLLSYDEYERLTSSPAKRFQSVCERISRNAKERGLTDEIFNDLITNNDE